MQHETQSSRLKTRKTRIANLGFRTCGRKPQESLYFWKTDTSDEEPTLPLLKSCGEILHLESSKISPQKPQRLNSINFPLSAAAPTSRWSELSTRRPYGRTYVTLTCLLHVFQSCWRRHSRYRWYSQGLRSEGGGLWLCIYCDFGDDDGVFCVLIPHIGFGGEEEVCQGG